MKGIDYKQSQYQCRPINEVDLLSNATVVERAVHFVDKHRGLMPQNKE